MDKRLFQDDLLILCFGSSRIHCTKEWLLWVFNPRCSQRWMYHLLECRWLPWNHPIHEIIPLVFYEDAVRPLHRTNFPTVFPIFRGKFPVICLCNDLGILSGSRVLPVTLRMKRLLNLTPGISPTLGGLPRFVVPSLCPSESCAALFLLCPLFFWDVDAILLVFFDEGKHDGGPFTLCLLALFLRGWSCQRLSLGHDLLAICVQVCS